MWRRYIGGRVSAGSLGSSLPSPGSPAFLCPGFYGRQMRKKMSAERFIVGPRRGLRRTIAHPSVKVSPSMTCRMRSILHGIPKNAEAKSRRGRWVKKPPAFLYREILSQNSEHPPGQLLILSLREIPSLSSNIRRETFLQNTRNPEKTLHSGILHISNTLSEDPVHKDSIVVTKTPRRHPFPKIPARFFTPRTCFRH